MKKLLLLSGLIIVQTLHGGHIGFSISFGICTPVYYPPVYIQPCTPVIVQPYIPVYVQPVPIIVQPTPVIVQPTVITIQSRPNHHRGHHTPKYPGGK